MRSLLRNSRGLAAVATIVGAAALVVAWYLASHPAPRADRILAAFDPTQSPGNLTVEYPPDGAVFPSPFPSPTVRWRDASQSDCWLVHLEFDDGEAGVSALLDGPQWMPAEGEWEAVQSRSLDRRATVTVLGVRRNRPGRILSSARISFSTSADAVGASVFYREVNLPFRDAVNDPSQIRWRLGEVSSSQRPRVVLENLPVCGNCHSFSADGRVLGMDVDYANDKGSYAVLPVSEEMVLEPNRIITWSDFKREEGQKTFGLLSQVSPDGKYVVSTVQDGAVFLPLPDLAYSQLFFPIKGILGVYSREHGTFRSLPGADDPKFVQSNAVWSSDGQWIAFARSKRYRTEGTGLLSVEECRAFTEEGQTIQFDLCRVPFNGGKGGRAELLAGASQNGMSNYFPRYSPDGRWIVFCQAKTFMLLQRDSALYVIPSGGGKARRLACNTAQMNSWHSFSPNGRWMVFSSKAFSPYTQLFLTHFDGEGNCSPPVVLANFTEPGRAANIPEFVQAPAGAIRRISERFLDDHSYARQSATNAQFDDLVRAEASCHRALELNPKNAIALCNLGSIRASQRRSSEALKLYRSSLEADPKLYAAHLSLGLLLLETNQAGEAAAAFKEAARLEPDEPAPHYQLGLAMQRLGQFGAAIAAYARVLQLNPDSAQALSQTAYLRATCRQQDLRDGPKAVEMAERACRLTQFADPEYLATLGTVYAMVGRHAEAVSASQRAVLIARQKGREEFAQRVTRDFQEYWRQHPPKPR